MVDNQIPPNENQPYHSVDIEKLEEIPWIISFEKELSILPPLSGNHCIYIVPPRLRRTARDESMYTPKIVSIGPIHHGTKGLEAMEEYKLRFLIDFLRRTGLKLEDFARFVKDREARLRECYADMIGLESDELTKIFMVDTAFLVELLLKHNWQPRGGNSRIFGRPGVKYDIIDDLILLENQLPMFILEDIFNSNWMREIGDEIDLVSLVCRLINGRLPWEAQEYDVEKVQSSKPLHILDCPRSCYIFAGSGSPQLRAREESTQSAYICSATEHDLLGIRIQMRFKGNLSSVSFKNRVLRVPRIYLGRTTEMIYRNVLAFEQCHCPADELLFTEFFLLMNRLGQTPKDIELLDKAGIVVMCNLGDSGEVANIFSAIAEGLTRPERYLFAGVYRDLTECHSSIWSWWKGMAKKKYLTYFKQPWALVSVTAAATILILTFIQTVFTIVK